MSQYTPEDYSNYRISKAKETLTEIDILIQNQLWNTAISRMYYACFYAVGALLIKNDITTGTHTGTRQKFGQFFVKPNIVDREIAKVYTKLYEKRNKGDYNDFIDFTQKDVEELLPDVIEFVNQINHILEIS